MVARISLVRENMDEPIGVPRARRVEVKPRPARVSIAEMCRAIQRARGVTAETPSARQALMRSRRVSVVAPGGVESAGVPPNVQYSARGNGSSRHASATISR